jgi:hypothetical protein
MNDSEKVRFPATLILGIAPPDTVWWVKLEAILHMVTREKLHPFRGPNSYPTRQDIKQENTLQHTTKQIAEA